MRERGFGFIRGEKGPELFFPRTTPEVPFEQLSEGQSVVVEIERDPPGRGDRAIRVRLAPKAGGMTAAARGSTAMAAERLFSRQPGVISVPHLRAFVHMRLQMGVDGQEVEEDLREVLFWGEVTDDESAVAAFYAEYFDLSAGVFPVTLDAHGYCQRVEE